MGGNRIESSDYTTQSQSANQRDWIESYNGSCELANALRYNTSLRELYIEDMERWYDYDTIPFIEALEYNTTLRYLNIRQRFTSPGGQRLISSKLTEMLEHNDTITWVNSYWILTCDTQNLLLDENRNGTRVAPKKGSRQRSDILHWLIQNWNQISNCSTTSHNNDTLPVVKFNSNKRTVPLKDKDFCCVKSVTNKKR